MIPVLESIYSGLQFPGIFQSKNTSWLCNLLWTRRIGTREI